MDDGTQYAIDMAAKLTGGSSSIDQLLELADRLTATATAATSFDAAIAQTQSALEQAATASTTVSSALEEAEARYAQLEKAAVRAWEAAERASLKGAIPEDMNQKLVTTAEALRAEGAALDELKAKSVAAASAQSQLAATLQKLEAGAKAETKTAAEAAAAIGKAMSALSKAPKPPIEPVLDKVVPKAQNLGETLEKLGGVLNRLGGPLGQLGGQAAGGAGSIAKLSTALGGATAGAIAFVAVVALVVIGLGAAIVKTGEWAVGLADSARSSHLANEALELTSKSIVGLDSILPSITHATGLADDAVRSLGEQLAGAKVSAKDMPAALKAAALAEAALGKGGASKFIEQLKTGQKTVGQFAADMETKFGGIVARKLLALDAQSETLKRNLGETFGGLKIEGLLGSLSTLVALFDANTESGQTMKFLFESVFQPLVDGVATAGPVLEAFVLGVEIAALEVYIAFKPAIKAAKELFGSGDDTTLPDALQVALFLGEQLAGVFFGVIVVLGLLAAAAAAPVGVFVALYGAASAAWDLLKSGGAAVLGYLQGINLGDVGANLVGGLATGILGGGPRVVAAITGVVSDAIGTAKRLLGIASDSKVFTAIGGYTAGGMETGVERGSAGVRSALESMVEPPDAQQATAGGAARARAAIDFSGAIFNFYGVKDAEDAKVKFQEMLTSLLEGDVSQLGAGQPEPA